MFVEIANDIHINFDLVRKISIMPAGNRNGNHQVVITYNEPRMVTEYGQSRTVEDYEAIYEGDLVQCRSYVKQLELQRR